MPKVKEVPVPRQLRDRPRDSHGFVIPWGVWVSPEGVPDFRINEETKRLQCYQQHLCGLCGKRLEDEFVFIGGNLSAENAMYFDPPSHEPCARYAKAVCPYLAFSTRDYRYGGEPPPQEDGTVFLDVGHLDKPDSFTMYFTRHMDLVAVPGRRELLFKAGPATRKESWRTA